MILRPRDLCVPTTSLHLQQIRRSSTRTLITDRHCSCHGRGHRSEADGRHRSRHPAPRDYRQPRTDPHRPNGSRRGRAPAHVAIPLGL